MRTLVSATIVLLLFTLTSCTAIPVRLTGCTTKAALQVVHHPLALKDVPQALVDQLDYPYVRFYRTDVTNHTERPMKIVWFDAYSEYDGYWAASNVRNKVLRNNDFTDWYGGDDLTEAGWLRPGGTASCFVNWHWTETYEDIITKWAFIGIDDQGNDYFGEAMVPEIQPEKLN